MRDITTIELQRTTHKRLKLFGNMDESFDIVITKLMDEVQELRSNLNDR